MDRYDLSEEVEQAQLDQYGQWFEAKSGDDRASAMFSAIRFCGHQKIPLPEWVVNEFFRATNDWYSNRVGTLDDAFGTKKITQGRLKQMKRRKLLAIQTKNLVTKAKLAGVSINYDLFEGIAEELGSSKTLVQDLYYNRRRKK